MRSVHWIGLILWRGGLLLALAAVLLETARWVLRFVNVPATLELGLGLLLAGFLCVLLSVLAERIRDARSEGDLRE
jgi:hypothetical protein